RLHRRAEEGHPRLRRRPSPLPLVAVEAADHDVFPGGMPTLCPGDDVIVGGVLPADALGAVLALPVVTGVDVLAAELDRSLPVADRAQKSDDRWHLHRERHRADQTILVLLDHLHFPEEK